MFKGCTTVVVETEIGSNELSAVNKLKYLSNITNNNRDAVQIILIDEVLD